jgi:hypothetical protein
MKIYGVKEEAIEETKEEEEEEIIKIDEELTPKNTKRKKK